VRILLLAGLGRTGGRGGAGRGGAGGAGGGPYPRRGLSPGCQAVTCCQVICRAVRRCQALSGASVRPAVRCCQCCRVLSGACLTSEVLSVAVGCCRSELSGVAVRRCQSCQSCRAAAAVRRRAGAVRCCQVVLSGCCQALTHTSHTYDTIKRRPAGLYYTSLYSASGPTIFFMVDAQLADDLVVVGPVEGLPIVVAHQLVVLARSVLVARAVWGVPSPFSPHGTTGG